METCTGKYEEFIKTFHSSLYSEEDLINLKNTIEASAMDDMEELSHSVLQGQYRLSYKLLQKLSLLKTSRVKESKNTTSGRKKSFELKITKMELLLLILILQMCDSNNRLHDFSYAKDIAPLRDFNGEPLFNKSTFYCVYASLQRKKIIIAKEEINGTVTLSIPDNNIGKNEKYVSLQTEFLLHDSELYLSFRNMKLASMKIYLFCLSKTYTGAGSPLNDSPSISVEEIKQSLGVSQNRTVRTYIESLEKAFGKLLFNPGGGRKAFIKGKLRFSNRNNKFCFSKRESLSSNQPNSFRRYFDRTIVEAGIVTDHHYDTLRTWVYMLMSSLKEEKIPKAFSFLFSVLLSYGKLDRLTFNYAAEKIINAYGA